MKNVNFFINWGFLLIQFITAVLAIRCWSKSRSINWKIFIVVWILTFLVEATGKILGRLGIHNIWLYNIFYIVFYPGIILLYADVFTGKRIQKLVITIIALSLTIWAIIHWLSHTNSQLNTYYITVSCSVIILLALSYLVTLFLDKEITTPLKNDYYYWFSTGLIIYFVFNAVMLGMYTKIIESKDPWLPQFTFYAGHLITFVLHFFLWIGFNAAFKWMK